MNNEEAEVIYEALKLKEDLTQSVLMDMPSKTQMEIDAKVIAAIAVLDNEGALDFDFLTAMD